MFTFTYIAYGIVRDEVGSVHADKCADIERDARRHGGHAVAGFASIEEAIGTEIFELGYTVEDVKILPCTRRRKTN